MCPNILVVSLFFDGFPYLQKPCQYHQQEGVKIAQKTEKLLKIVRLLLFAFADFWATPCKLEYYLH